LVVRKILEVVPAACEGVVGAGVDFGAEEGVDGVAGIAGVVLPLAPADEAGEFAVLESVPAANIRKPAEAGTIGVFAKSSL